MRKGGWDQVETTDLQQENGLQYVGKHMGHLENIHCLENHVDNINHLKNIDFNLEKYLK